MFAVVSFIAIIPSVAAIAVGLLALGLGLSVLTWWFWKTARPEPIALAPLEIMSDRRYAQSSAAEREKMLESVRGLVKLAHRPIAPRQASPNLQRPGPVPQPKVQRTPSAPIDPLLK